MSSKANAIYQEVTNIIIDLLEEVKKGNYQKQWISVGADGVTPHNAESGYIYRGINALLLSVIAIKENYDFGRWLTFLQVKKLGGSVKGKSGYPVVKYGFSYRDNANKKISEKTAQKLIENGEKVTKIPYLKKITVFNVEQVTGLPEKFYAQKKLDNLQEVNSINKPEYILNNCGAEIEEKAQDQAFYIPNLDKIILPLRTQFKGNAVNFYTTAFHEIGHWTGHKTRLNRDLNHSFGSPKYAFEELIAEMTANFLATLTNLDYDMQNSVKYLDSWLNCLKNEPKAIITASKLAQNASDFIIEKCKLNLSIAA